MNGVEVENLKRLRKLVEDCREESPRIELDDDWVVVRNYESAKVSTSRILTRHRIPSAMASDLMSSSTPALKCEVTSSVGDDLYFPLRFFSSQS